MAGQPAADNHPRRHHALWWWSLAVPALLAWLSWPSPSPQSDTARSEQSAALPAPQLQPATAGLRSALLAEDLQSALQAARRDLDETAWRSLRRRVDDACVVPTLLRLDGRREPDPRRDWARDALLRRCAGLPAPSLYRPGLEVRAERADVDPLPEPTTAMAQLRAARDGQALVRAWLEAWLVDALPQEQIFADGRRLLPADAEGLIAVVQDWRDCAVARACGPDSLLTLKVCAMHGCRPGADLLEAWHEALSPRDYSAAQAIHHWLRAEVPVDAG